MQLHHLRLSGFKSFVEPATLKIEPGLTGVVGPNGCGKSNLLEAIRWVMGETSAKSLRSGGMEDVIFAGTATRPPRDFAEVVLGGADSEGEELEVVRRIERGAGSAYRINGRDVRAKDVALVFADAATGAHSPALVSQGKIAQVIAARPEERRMMLEEAAGIAGLHVRRRDAESKLRQTEANLARLDDLMAGLDSQIASLRRQAKQAERYKAISEELRGVEARVVFARWRDAAEAAEAAKRASEAAEEAVGKAQLAASAAQGAQRTTAEALAEARDEHADRRDDATAHGHRMATLTSQLEAAEQRLADLERQRGRLEEDRGDADRLTRDAAAALAQLEARLVAGKAALEASEAARPALARAAETAEGAGRAAELALAKATADHAGVEAEWRVVEAEVAQARARLARAESEEQRLAAMRTDLTDQADHEDAVSAAKAATVAARSAIVLRQAKLEQMQARKLVLQSTRDEAASALAAARAELAGVAREHEALRRDREARDRAAEKRAGQRQAIDAVTAERGYERALAAVLGRDGKAVLGAAEGTDGRFWTGAKAARTVAQPLAAHVGACPPELAARLALVHVAPEDDGRTLAPGEWLVTLAGELRRWDGLVVRGEGAAEAARLEADNRFRELAALLPPLENAVAGAASAQEASATELSALQRELVGAERAVSRAIDEERAALRALDQAEAARDRAASRLADLDRQAADLAEQLQQARRDSMQAEAKREGLPDPEAGRAALDAARSRNDQARSTLQAALAALAAHDQQVAIERERAQAQRAEVAGWQARSGDAARRLAEMARRLEEIGEEHAIIAAKPAGLMREIEQGDTVRARIAADLAAAEEAVRTAQAAATAADAAQAAATEALATAREARAGLAARAENENARRIEMGRVSGERFQCPPPLLPDRFGFAADTVGGAEEESAAMERLAAARERIGPVNLVAADELARIEGEHGSTAAEQAELTEAVHRLRGSIGSLNREGRERLREAFEKVDTHFRRLFTRLFAGGEAHLALVDSEDPLEAGLEIFAQPPGKRLQSLTLLSGGEQALTAIALIFALFLTNPAPICVLDEVDAPLDDANVDRFCDLLDAMVAETATRYLIVTHKAVSMSRMHRLFGVTMVEKGVSRLVSVDLGAAEALLAAE